MPKLLCVVRSLVAGGVETCALTLHRQLVEARDWKVCLALLESYGDLLGEGRKLRSVLIPRTGSQTPSQREDLKLILRSVPRMISYSCRLRRMLVRFRPHLLFSHSGMEMLAAGAPLRRRRCVWVAGVGSDVMRDLDRKHPLLAGLFRPPLAALHRGPDRFITASQGLRNALVDRLAVPAHKVEVIPNPVDLASLRAGARADLAATRPFVLGVGRLSRTKGFDVLIRAVAELDRSRGPVDLVLLGEGEERLHLQALAGQLGYAGLSMPGFDPNPGRYMARALAVAVSSRLEGFSNVTVEAMATGAPVVVTDCPHGPREIVCEGKHGLLVPTEDAAALTKALAELHEKPELRAELSRRGLERSQDFDAPRVARRYLDFFSSLLP